MEPTIRLQDLLEFQPEAGQILMKGARILLVNADAMGMLRRDLISVLGQDRAKGFLLRYGFECGYNDAISVRQQNPECSDQFWSEQGPLMHTLEGVTHVAARNMTLDRSRGYYYVQGIWRHSYEADQHLRHFGIADAPVCWTLIGYAGGYATAVVGHRVVFRETRCAGMGHPHCEFVGKTIADWGDEIAEELPFYGESKLAEELEEAHRKIQHQHRQLQQIMLVHEQLSRLVLQGKGPQALVETVGQILTAPVLVEDRYFHLRAQFLPTGWTGPARAYSLGLVAAAEPALRERLHALERDRLAFRLGPEDHPALAPRVVAPILLGSDVMGYLSVLREDDGAQGLTRMITERAAMVIGLELLKERTALETEHRLKGEFIEELLGGASPVAVRHRALHMGCDLDQPHRFVLVRIDLPVPGDLAPGSGDPLLRRRKELFEAVRAAISAGPAHPLLVERGEGLLILLPAGLGGTAPEGIVRTVQQQARETLRGLSVSICISREAAAPGELKTVFDECQSLLLIQGKLGRRGSVLSVDDVGSFQLLCAGLDQAPMRAYAERKLGPVIEHDTRHGTQLAATLYWYLAHEGHLQHTAEALNISLSGLKYRLSRLRELARFDLDDPDVRFDLLLALKILTATGTVDLGT